jgi:hypothetical protein
MDLTDEQREAIRRRIPISWSVPAQASTDDPAGESPCSVGEDFGPPPADPLSQV